LSIIAVVTLPEISINTLSPDTDTSGHDLLITVSAGFFAYTIFDENGLLRLFEKYTHTGQNVDSSPSFNIQSKWITHHFRQVKVAYFTPDAITIPARLYQPASASGQLDYVYGDAGEELLLNDFISQRSVYCLYRVEKDLVRSVVRRFPLASVWHVQSLLLSRKTPAENGALLHINFLQDACCFILQKDNQLLSVKSCPLKHIPDLAYTILGFCTLHHVLPADVQLTVGGWITAGSPMHEELRKYFQHIGFAGYPPLPEGFEQFPAHFFELFYLLQSI
jgi:hypothetical protein